MKLSIVKIIFRFFFSKNRVKYIIFNFLDIKIIFFFIILIIYLAGTKYLSESTKEKFLDTVNRTSSNEKINGLLTKKNDFIDEMNHISFMSQNIPIDMDKWFTSSRLIVTMSAFIINFLILFDHFTAECIECSESNRYSNPCVCDL